MTPIQQEKVWKLEAQLANLSGGNKAFALRMLATITHWNKCSEKQEAQLDRLYDEACGFKEPVQPTKMEEVGSFSKVLALFAKAKTHLQFPKITLQVDDQPVALTVAGAKSVAPGTVQVTDGKPYGQNVWFGRVDPSGVWTQSRKADESTLAKVRELLKAMGENPAGTAKKYGMLTGRCCFCQLKLTDKHSTAAGFGRTCAKNYDLLPQYKAATAVLDEVKSEAVTS